MNIPSKELTFEELKKVRENGDRTVRIVNKDNSNEYVILSIITLPNELITYRKFSQLKDRTENQCTNYSDKKFYALTQEDKKTVDFILSNIEEELLKGSKELTNKILEIGAMIERMPYWERASTKKIKVSINHED